MEFLDWFDTIFKHATSPETTLISTANIDSIVAVPWTRTQNMYGADWTPNLCSFIAILATFLILFAYLLGPLNYIQNYQVTPQLSYVHTFLKC